MTDKLFITFLIVFFAGSAFGSVTSGEITKSFFKGLTNQEPDVWAGKMGTSMRKWFVRQPNENNDPTN